MSFRTVFIENPCRLSYTSGYLVVRKDDDTIKVHLSEISALILQTRQVYIGQYLPLYGAHNVGKRVMEQLAWNEPIKKRVWQHIVRDKISEQARFLEQRDYTEGKTLREIAREVRSGDTTNREAQAARIYFRTLFGNSFSRSSDCFINAALDYGYAILLSMVNREIVSRGFLTQSGICHRSEYNQFNLACDFMEPFRPAVDRLVVDYLADEFDADARRVLGDLANKGIAYRDGSYRLGSVVSFYVQDCLNALNKKISVDEIEGFNIL